MLLIEEKRLEREKRRLEKQTRALLKIDPDLDLDPSQKIKSSKRIVESEDEEVNELINYIITNFIGDECECLHQEN